MTFWGAGQIADRRPSADANVARLEVAGRLADLDHLFVGSSYTYSAVDPNGLGAAGARAYNLGTPSAGPGFYELLLEDYLAASGSTPGRIVFEVSPLAFSPRSDRWADYPVHRRLVSPRSHEAVALRFGAFDQYPMMVLGSARKLLNRSPSASSVESALATALRNRGHFPSDEVFSERVFEATRHLYEPFREAGFSHRKRDRLLSLIERAGETGSEVVLLEIPTFKLSEFFSSEALSLYRETLLDFETRGFIVLRMPSPPPADRFRNIDHMNSRGAAEFTTWLAGRLSTVG